MVIDSRSRNSRCFPSNVVQHRYRNHGDGNRTNVMPICAPIELAAIGRSSWILFSRHVAGNPAKWCRPRGLSHTESSRVRVTGSHNRDVFGVATQRLSAICSIIQPALRRLQRRRRGDYRDIDQHYLSRRFAGWRWKTNTRMTRPIPPNSPEARSAQQAP